MRKRELETIPAWLLQHVLPILVRPVILLVFVSRILFCSGKTGKGRRAKISKSEDDRNATFPIKASENKFCENKENLAGSLFASPFGNARKPQFSFQSVTWEKRRENSKL